jgi:hypothetical protein
MRGWGRDTGVSRAEKLSRPGLAGWRARRRYRFALRCAGKLRGARVLDVGGAHGVFAGMLLGAGAAAVTVIEQKESHYAEGARVQRDPRIRFVHDDVFARLDLLAECDVLSALHCLHQLGPSVHELFDAVAASPVRKVLLQGSTSHEVWIEPEHELWGPVLGLPRGMLGLLEKHGFSTALYPHRRYPVAIGNR